MNDINDREQGAAPSPSKAAGWLLGIAANDPAGVRDWVVQVLPEEGHPDECLDREAKPVFERDDLSDVVSAMNYRRAFYAFVQRRFYEVAASGFEFDAGAIGTVTVNDLPEDTWTDWRVPASFEDGYASLANGFIPVQRVNLDDRGGETFGAVVRFDLDVLFGEREQVEREERYQRYLRLKAEFEPTA